MPIDANIPVLLPHGDGMSLIDEVIALSETSITVRTLSHTRENNPLRQAGRLHACHLIEYAAQATAIHSALNGSAEPGQLRVIGAVREMKLPDYDLAGRLEPIAVHCTLTAGNPAGAIYEFRIDHTCSNAAAGRLTLVSPPLGSTL